MKIWQDTYSLLYSHFEDGGVHSFLRADEFVVHYWRSFRVIVLLQNASFGLTPENTSVSNSPSAEIHFAGRRYLCVPGTSHCRCRTVVHGPHGSGASKRPHAPSLS
jgi:hypothetical protein